VTDRTLDSFGAGLTREPDQEGNTRGFFEHCFFPEQVMRAQAIAMIARVNNDRVISSDQSFQATRMAPMLWSTSVTKPR
jgi:hypothetical protein